MSSNFLLLVPLNSKTGTPEASAFQSLFKGSRRRPVSLLTHKCKEFLYNHMQDMLKHEGIQFQVCRNPDVKYSVVVRAIPTIRDRLYKYFTYKST